ncbi:hypothetical protein P152DRAFT_458179 [Eremomyces bilateralis CBS 781.70]|uniref:ATP-dependent protease n=1 Tax=Eremomyces bilateralis CBS 781.70 TaxID=1392243 RepID=A0A6G1G5A4_9PEZI|nr:uncharacterized protein P152DRAFT_458179 [Eremomyces bilateralis CBS 781.70]KAF1813009.1 hypothetical protein P152DRAFT_458179 [Eremomyces bilateralis CBS 781.70]
MAGNVPFDRLAYTSIELLLNSLPDRNDIPEITDHDAELDSVPNPGEEQMDTPLKELEEVVDIAEDASSDLFARALTRLLQCMVCSYPLRDGINLPCGHSVCRQCISTEGNGTVAVAGEKPSIGNAEGLMCCPVRTCRKLTASASMKVDRSLMAVVDCMLRLIKETSEVSIPQLVAGHTERLAQYSANHPWSYDAEGDRAAHLKKYVLLKQLLHTKTVETALIPTFPHLCSMFAFAAQGRFPYDNDLIFERPTPDSGQTSQINLEMPNLVRNQLERELDCPICYKLLLYPTTTSCGHTFCRSCLLRALDFSILCPNCRQELKMHGTLQGHEPNRVVTGLTQLLFPDRSEQRRQEDLAELHDGDEPDEIPLFVCTIAYPQVPIYLHIFEPRYRIMIRRSWEGNRQFGMVFFAKCLQEQHGEDASTQDLGNPGQLMPGKYYMEYGTILQIVEKGDLQSGRINLQLVGVSRFRTVSVRRHEDGYLMARIERLQDVSDELEASIEAAEVGSKGELNLSDRTGSGSGRLDTKFVQCYGQQYFRTLNSLTNAELMKKIHTWIPLYNSWLRPSTRRKIRIAYGDPPLDDPKVLPYWTMHMMPTNQDELYRMLKADTVRERLKLTCRLIDEIGIHEWCSPFIPIRVVTLRRILAIVCLFLALSIARTI